MKIKLDENLPPRAADVFVIQGHDTDTVDQEGLAGADDATVAKAATDDGRLIVTLDRGFGDVQHYPPGSHAGILVLRTTDQSADAICDDLSALIESTDLNTLRGCGAVLHRGNLRVRRSAQD